MTRPARRTTDASAFGASLYEELASSPRGSAELAGAELALQVQQLIASAFASSDLPASQVAASLGVSESRVSQIRNGDGNVRISTLGKVLNALGKELKVSVQDVGTSEAESNRPSKPTHDKWSQVFLHSDGVLVHTYDLKWRSHGEMTPYGPPARHQTERGRDSSSSSDPEIFSSTFATWVIEMTEDADRRLAKRLSR